MTDDAKPTFSLSTSPSIGAIAKALAAGQAAMLPATKDRVGIIPGKEGRQGYQYTYATLAACFEAIQPLHAQGIAVTQIPLSVQNGVLVATLLIHESGEWIRGEMWMPTSQTTPQGYGSALTYARRYGLCALCGLASDDEDDDGVAASAGSQRALAREPSKPATKAAPVADLGLFANFCDRVDNAETDAALNGIASGALKAHREGKITDSHIDQIKASVTKKRSLLVQALPANGGAS